MVHIQIETTGLCGAITTGYERRKGEINMIFESHAHYDDEDFDADRETAFFTAAARESHGSQYRRQSGGSEAT